MFKQLKTGLFLLLQAACFTVSAQHSMQGSKTFKEMNEQKQHAAIHRDTATFAAGCFWCTEAQFQQLKGVISVESGFAGGTVKNPSYKEVCTGSTGHAEVCNIIYDPSVISYDEMLAAFWMTHDPTQLNRQGNDVGTQYRSAIFYHSEAQRLKAEEYKKKLNDEKVFDKPVVTTLEPYTAFYKAEDYHQNYFKENGAQPYCKFVVLPKVEKFQKVFKDKLKK